MKGTFAVLWSLRAELHTGRLEVLHDRLELRARGRTLSIPIGSVVRCSIDRDPGARIRGLPVLRLDLADGTVARIASLESVTVLNDLAGVLAGPVPAEAL
ncbi:MAG TPA: hypothetical protein VKI43_11910 [Vicinamibacterales bacterium]|nr:hypothetical protein [Vicinamibacterales bacterium]